MLLEFLDRISCGGLLIDQAGNVVGLNGTAREVLAEKTGAAIDIRDTAGAQRGLERIIGGEIRRFIAAESFLVTDEGERWPIVVRAVRSRGAPTASAIILLDLNRQSPPHVEALQTTFGLTGSEANLAVQIARGRTLTEISQTQGVSMHTVRGHLASTFSKTRTRRQAELTALMARLSLI